MRKCALFTIHLIKDDLKLLQILYRDTHEMVWIAHFLLKYYIFNISFEEALQFLRYCFHHAFGTEFGC